MTLSTKSIGFEIKALDDDLGTFTAYGNTFGKVDHANDMTMKGAFTKCIQGWNAKNRQPRLLSQHGHRQNPIGIITSMKEDDHGLLFEGKFCVEPGTAGAEAYALAKMGALDMFSIGYNTIKQKANNGVNELHELDVKEISIVTFACNEDSLIQSIKSALESGDEVTRMVQKSLQEAGLSKRQAAAAVDAIKVTGDQEVLEQSTLEIFKAKAESNVLSTKMLDMHSDMSLNEYVEMICKSVMMAIETDEVYSYVKNIYMDYVIVECYDYSDSSNVKEMYKKVPYSVSDNDVLVGTPVEVVKDVQWLTADEQAAREQAGVKSIEVAEIDTLVSELKSTDFSKWFK